MSNKESLIPTSNIAGTRRRLAIKEIYSAFYISQVNKTDSQLYLFFMSLISLFLQSIAFYTLIQRVESDTEYRAKEHHASGMVGLAQSVFALLFTAKLVKTIQNQQLVHAHAVQDYNNDHIWLIRHLPTLFEFLNGASVLATGLYVLGQGIDLVHLLEFYVILYVIQEIPTQVWHMASFISEDVEERIQFVLTYTNEKDAHRGFRYWNWILPVAVVVAVQWRNFAHAKEDKPTSQ